MPSWRIECDDMIPELESARFPDEYQALAVIYRLDPGDLFRDAEWEAVPCPDEPPHSTAAEWITDWPPPPGVCPICRVDNVTRAAGAASGYCEECHTNVPVFLRGAVETAVRCTACDWRGPECDLVPFTDDDGRGDGCPNCRTDSRLIDVPPAVSPDPRP